MLDKSDLLNFEHAAFYMPEHTDQFNTYTQIVHKSDAGAGLTVSDIHFYVCESRVSLVREQLGVHYKNAQEVGKTRAYGHTLGIKQLCDRERKKLGVFADTIKKNGRIIPFMKNVFETDRGADYLMAEMAQKYDHGVVEVTLYEENGYAKLKNDYLNNIFPKAQYGYRKQQQENIIDRFVNLCTTPPSNEEIWDKYWAYLDRNGSDPDVYNTYIKHVQSKPTLFQGVA